MNKQKVEQIAHQNAKLKVEFRIHLITYMVVNSLLAIINLTLTHGYYWFIWPLLGWGIGIIIHGIHVHFSKSPGLKERMIEKEMRKAGLMIFFILLMANIYAQETEVLQSNDKQSVKSYSGYGGPLAFGTQVKDELSLFLGGKGGVVINKSFALGGIGYGKVNSPGFTGDNLSGNTTAELQMSYGAGGLFFEYISNSDNLIHFTIPINLMAGGISIYENDPEDEIESSAFFILEPGISLDFNVSGHYTQSLYVCYRLAFGSSLENLEGKDISGLNAGLVFKFGKR